MIEWAIEPYVSVGPLRLGDTIEEIRAFVDSKPQPFKRTPDVIVPADLFKNLGVFVYYKPPGLCAAVEFAGQVSPTLFGQTLLGRPFVDAFNWLRWLDKGVVENDAGVSSFEYGVGLFAPSFKEEPAEPVEAVIVFERGYYE